MQAFAGRVAAVLLSLKQTKNQHMCFNLCSIAMGLKNTLNYLLI